jgi:hypothetical protein
MSITKMARKQRPPVTNSAEKKTLNHDLSSMIQLKETGNLSPMTGTIATFCCGKIAINPFLNNNPLFASSRARPV